MLRRRLESSLVASVGYDEKGRTLEIELVGRGVYRYFDVPELVYHRFIRAESPGAFFNKEIRDRYLSRHI